jgi:hypothetical protein
MGKTKLWPPPHQIEDRTKCAFCGLPGVSYWPEPSQVEMSVRNPKDFTLGGLRGSELFIHSL